MKTKKAKLIKLKPCKSRRGETDYVHWTEAEAFAANVRGVLTHRVRHVTTILRGGEKSHHHITYLCGNGCNVDLVSMSETLASDPPKDRLLCESCEVRAKRFKLPTGDDLAGRHVHRGVLVPQRTCCLK